MEGTGKLILVSLKDMYVRHDPPRQYLRTGFVLRIFPMILLARGQTKKTKIKIKHQLRNV